MLRIIREEEPPKPSTRLSTTDELPQYRRQPRLRAEEAERTGPRRTRLGRDEGLEKDRNRRYETANGFAADIQRYLHDEPVQACPPSTGYRLKKLLRREQRASRGDCTNISGARCRRHWDDVGADRGPAAGGARRRG